MAAIRIRVGTKNSNQVIEKVFNQHEIAIGRAADNDVILKKDNVSKLHCRAIFAKGLILLGDAESRNGTFINGSRVVGWVPVRPADIVEVGHYRLTFAIEDDSRPNDTHKEERTFGGKNRQRQNQHKTREQKKVDPPPVEAMGSQPRSPWVVLGIPKGTPKADAKKAYMKLLSMYHPDKVDSLGPRIKELALEVTRELNDAWAKIESGKA
jgi:pSer/pThr/pTyr-binding forkhead associated (FHA) protein